MKVKVNETIQGVSRCARRAAIVLVLSTIAMAHSATGQAQSTAKPTPPAAPAASQLNGSPKPDNSVARQISESGLNTGIKVHGHWTIDVKNPDGTLVSHHEFENALSGSGQISLAEILSRQFATSFWSIDLALSAAGQSGGGSAPCTATDAVYTGTVNCFITEPQVSLSSGMLNGTVLLAGCTATANCSNNLAILVSTPTSPSFSITGSVTAAQAGTIDTVSTILNQCGGASGSGSSNYASCLAGTLLLTSTGTADTIWVFSSTTLTSGGAQPPIQVTAAGQIIQTSVQFTFN